MSVVQREVTREDRARAVWRGFCRIHEEGATMLDTLGPMWWRNAPRKSSERIIPRNRVLLIRWHHILRPWLYPDPNPMPRIRLLRVSHPRERMSS